MSSTLNAAFAEPPDLLPGLRSRRGPSYEELVRRYRGRMLGVARRMVRDSEDARDCVQEAFFLAFKNIHSFEGRSSIWTWLRSIVVNVSLMRLRYRRRRPEISIEDVLPKLDRFDRSIEMRDWHHADGEALPAREDARHTVRRAIESLPDTYRDVLRLRDIGELDTEETAEILKISRGAVKVRSHRARAALKKLIESGARPSFRLASSLDLGPGSRV
jgi:RNA polymerase sigma-70 factor (ECF subfamily)